MNKKYAVFCRAAALVMAAVLMLSLLPLVRAVVPDEVSEAQNAVVLVAYCYPDPNDRAKLLYASFGSGFLINDRMVITAHHVICPEELTQVLDNGKTLLQTLQAKDPYWRVKMEARVYYAPGAYYLAEEISNLSNAAYDYTGLILQRNMKGARPMTLCTDTDTSLDTSSAVSALGYIARNAVYASPTGSDGIRDVFGYLSSESVSSVSGMYKDTVQWNGKPYVSHSAALNEVMSGGPLLNDKGQVVGINLLAHYGSLSANYAVPVGELIRILNSLGVEYRADAYGAPPPKAKEENGKVYAVPELTPRALYSALSVASGAKIMKTDGTELKAYETVGSGMTLVKRHGSTVPIIIKGDTDGDSRVTANDARFALRISVRLERPNAWQTEASRVSGGSEISAADARAILRASVKLENLPLV